MKSEEGGRRAYRKTARADAEHATGEAILVAARRAFAADAFDRVTLARIAEESGVAVQTVIRRFGSKEGLFEAFVDRERPRLLASRDSSQEAGLVAAIRKLVDHYERDGDLILSFVAQEGRTEAIGAIVVEGRNVHRTWVETHCSGVLASLRGKERSIARGAAIAATDLGTWKLLRRDLGFSQDDVAAIMASLVAGLERRNA